MASFDLSTNAFICDSILCVISPEVSAAPRAPLTLFISVSNFFFSLVTSVSLFFILSRELLNSALVAIISFSLPLDKAALNFSALAVSSSYSLLALPANSPRDVNFVSTFDICVSRFPCMSNFTTISFAAFVFKSESFDSAFSNAYALSFSADEIDFS